MDDVIFARMPSLLDVAAKLKRIAHAAVGLAINCAHTQRDYFSVLKVTSQVATPGAESAVYDWLVVCLCLCAYLWVCTVYVKLTNAPSLSMVDTPPRQHSDVIFTTFAQTLSIENDRLIDCVAGAGPPCFVPMTGVSAGFTKSVAIPSQYLGNRQVHPLYCMAACELTTSCVGFDLLTVDARPRCAFLDLQVFPSASFNLDIRRC